MKNVKMTVLFLVLFVFFAVSAQESDQDPEVSDQDTADIETPDQESPDEEPVVPENNKGKMIGGDPAMSWEDGGQDFFVMFNSNVDDKIKLKDDKDENPQGDTCVESSSFVLDSFHVPEDAIIEKAYLIWMGSVDPDKLNDPTDNKVHLAFTQTADKNVEYALKTMSHSAVLKHQAARTLPILRLVSSPTVLMSQTSLIRFMRSTRRQNIRKEPANITEHTLSAVLNAQSMTLTAATRRWSVHGRFSSSTDRRTSDRKRFISTTVSRLFTARNPLLK